MNLNKLYEIVEDTGARRAAIHGIANLRHDLATVQHLLETWKSPSEKENGRVSLSVLGAKHITI